MQEIMINASAHWNREESTFSATGNSLGWGLTLTLRAMETSPDDSQAVLEGAASLSCGAPEWSRALRDVLQACEGIQGEGNPATWFNLRALVRACLSQVLKGAKPEQGLAAAVREAVQGMLAPDRLLLLRATLDWYANRFGGAYRRVQALVEEPGALQSRRSQEFLCDAFLACNRPDPVEVLRRLDEPADRRSAAQVLQLVS